MNPEVKKLLINTGIPACIAALIISISILNFDTLSCTAAQEKRTYDKMVRISNASDKIHQDIEEKSAEQAHADPRYQKLVTQINICTQNMQRTRNTNPTEYKKHLWEYINLCDRAAAIEDSILFANVKHSKPLHRKAKRYQKAKKQYEKIQSRRNSQKLR